MLLRFYVSSFDLLIHHCNLILLYGQRPQLKPVGIRSEMYVDCGRALIRLADILCEEGSQLSQKVLTGFAKDYPGG